MGCSGSKRRRAIADGALRAVALAATLACLASCGGGDEVEEPGATALRLFETARIDEPADELLRTLFEPLPVEEGRAALLDALEGLAHAAEQQVRTFSSGMRKRLALSRATLHDPELVLLDEPYGALDVEGIGWVDRFIGELREADKTLVIATNEIGRALALCDRAISLRGGRVVFDGPTSDYEGAISGATESVGMKADDNG